VPFLALAALILAIAAAAGPVGTAAGFEDDDGNLVANGTTPNFDWNSFATTLWTGTPPYQSSTKIVSGWAFTGLSDAEAVTSDTNFNGGVKQDDNCAGVGAGKSSNKDDLKRIYVASKTVSGHVYLELAWVRIPQNTTSPSAHVAFEFNQGTTACPAGSNGLVQRSTTNGGDMLIVYDFEGGSGDEPVLTLRRWIASGSCEVSADSPPCWGVATNLTAGGFAEAKVNTTASASDTISPSSPASVSLGLSEFGEAGIDLTNAGVFSANACTGFGKVFGVSRSSGNSGTAQMKDLVGPGTISLSNCGTIIIKKRSNPRGLDQNFDFTSNIAGSTLNCSPDSAPASFTLNDKAGATGDSTAAGGNTETCLNVPAGTYAVTEGADPAGFAFDSYSCSASGTGTSYTSGATAKQVSITIAGGGSVTCIYTNNQQAGAIKVAKVSIKTGNAQLAGATIAIKDPDGNHVAGSPFTTSASGAICVDGLTKLGTYTVQETAAPAGFFLDDNTAHNVSVTATNAKCTDASFGGGTYTFNDTPKTDVVVTATSQFSGAGGTKSSIRCTGPSPGTSNIGNSPVGVPTMVDPATMTAPGLAPGTYSCTIVIDP
jgi:hypothetical protein